MLEYLISIWRSGLRIGYHATVPGLSRGRVILLNSLVIIATFSALLFSIFYAIIAYQYFYGPLYIVPGSALVLYLNSKGEFWKAKRIYLLYALLVFSYWCYEGRGNGNEYTLIGLATTATLLLEKRWEIVITNVLCVLVFIGYNVYHLSTSFVPDPAINYNILPVIILLNTVGIVSYQIAFYRDLAQYYDKKLTTKYKELRAAEEGLKSTNEDLFLQKEKLQNSLSQLKSTQKQLIDTEKMASLGILSAGIAHEINNPLNYIYNGTAAIESYISENCSDEVANLNPLFNAVNTGVERILGIVKSMNRYTRKEDLPYTQCIIPEVIENCLTLLNDKIHNKVKIERSYPPECPMYYANEGQLHQAFLNILINAIQAIENKGTVSIEVFVNNKQIVVAIADNGKGISLENLNHIFDPFFTTKDPGEGTGLGLSITKKIIEEHQGTIWCNSSTGNGTTFNISFPLIDQ